MAVALGQLDGATVMLFEPTFYYDPLGIEIDDSVIREWGAMTNKESFFELDSDIHLVDTNALMQWTDLTQSDIDEIEQATGPFFGVRIARSQHEWQHDYPQCTLFDRFEKLAAVLKEQSRFEAFEALHDEVRSRTESKTEAITEQPTIGLINSGSNPEEGEFFTLALPGEGAEVKACQRMPIRDGFAGQARDQATVDYEALLEADPDEISLSTGASARPSLNSRRSSSSRSKIIPSAAN
jgi:iron complex transport system substrate-binding protein